MVILYSSNIPGMLIGTGACAGGQHAALSAPLCSNISRIYLDYILSPLCMAFVVIVWEYYYYVLYWEYFPPVSAVTVSMEHIKKLHKQAARTQQRTTKPHKSADEELERVTQCASQNVKDMRRYDRTQAGA